MIINPTSLRSNSNPFLGGAITLADGTNTTLSQVGNTITFNTTLTPSFTSVTISSMTPGSVIFAGTGGLLSQDNAHFFYDDTNDKLKLRQLEFISTTETSAFSYINIPNSTTLTLNLTGTNTVLTFSPTVVFEQANSVFAGQYLAPSLKNPSSEANNFGVVFGIFDNTQLVADTQTISCTQFASVASNPSFQRTGGGTLNIVASYGLVYAPEVLTGVTVSNSTGVNIQDAGGSGAVTAQYGIDIADLTRGATNTAIRTQGIAKTEIGGPIEFGATNATISSLSPYQYIDSTITMTSVVEVPMIDLKPTFVQGITGSGSGNQFSYVGVINRPTLKNPNANAYNFDIISCVYDTPTLEADGQTITCTGVLTFNSAPTLTRINSGVLTVSNLYSFFSQASINTGVTVTTRRGLSVSNFIGSGTVTTQTGVFISALSGATNNWAIETQGTANSRFGGKLQLGSSSVTPTGMLDIVNLAATDVSLRVSGASAQSANYIHVEDSAAALVFNLTKDGLIQVPVTTGGVSFNGTSGTQKIFGGSGFGVDVFNFTSNSVYFFDITTATANSRYQFQLGTNDNTHSFNVYNNSVAAIFTVTGDGFAEVSGKMKIGGMTAPTNQLEVIPASSTTIGLSITAAASQSADLFLVEDSSGNDLFRVDSNGNLELRPANFTTTTFVQGTLVDFDATVTLNFSSAGMAICDFGPTVIYDQAASTTDGFYGVRVNPTLKNITTEGNNLGTTVGFDSSFTFNNDTATISNTAHYGFRSRLTTTTTGGNSALYSTMVDFIADASTFGSLGPILSKVGFQVNDKAGAGTVLTQVGLLINDLVGGSTNISMRILGTAGSRHVPDFTFGSDVAPSHYVHINPNARTAVTTEKSELYSSAQTITINSGSTVTNYRQNQFYAPTINGVAGGGVETVTNAATVYIDNAPGGSNITFTNGPYALWVDGGQSRFDGTVEAQGRVEFNSKTTVSLTADNQVVDVTNTSYLSLSSNNGTPANRTFVLTQSTRAGQILYIEWTGTNAGELVDDSAQSGGGNHRLSANWTPTQYDTLTLLSNGTDWIEICRSTN